MGSSLRFADAVRMVAAEARALGLEVPGFRSPPRLPGVDRSLRHRPGAPPAIAVRLSGRPFDDVVVDMVDGVIVANGLSGRRAADVRERLRSAASRGTATAAA